jgi:hypothetical protein
MIDARAHPSVTAVHHTTSGELLPIPRCGVTIRMSNSQLKNPETVTASPSNRGIVRERVVTPPINAADHTAI